MACVLVADDDAHIREVVRFALTRAGHTVELASDGLGAVARVGKGGVDLVVLDVLMPELDGLAVCREIRGHTAILMLSSRGEELDRVLGLELGADDYLAKPFSPRELVARVSAVLRRGAQPVVTSRPPLAVGDVVVDRDRHELRVRDVPTAVTATELRLLGALAEHKGRVLSRTQLIAVAYGDDHHITERTIDTHIRNLRAKLGDALKIETVHGVGYRCG